jgi:hypothetical protein
MGIPRKVVFTIPVEASEPILLALPETCAQIILEGAAAAGLQPGQYLAAVVTSAASNREIHGTNCGLLESLGLREASLSTCAPKAPR